MLYFKNSELSEAYHVSLRTVLNWIEAAKNNKLDLVLHRHKGKIYVANTTRNITTIEELVKKRRKYRNSRSYKVVTPTPTFYELYSEDQILDIIKNIEIYNEIPNQYNYFGKGAEYWSEYAVRLSKEKSANLLNSTHKLLRLNEQYLDDLAAAKIVNIIDIGVGDALHVRPLIEHLRARGVFGRYIGVDISKRMLEMAQDNLETWFDDIAIECHEADISFERFTKLAAKEYIAGPSDDVVNVVLLLGGTLANFRDPDSALRTIHDSLGLKDIFIHSLKLDTPGSRKYFDFGSEAGETHLSPSDKLIVDLLGIDDSLYDVEMGFDEATAHRFIRLHLKVALTIDFNLSIGMRKLEFNKDDVIQVWRYWHQDAMDVLSQFDRCGFHPLQMSQTDDKEYLLTISKIKT